MRITERFKNLLKRAQAEGETHIEISKNSRYGNYAVVSVAIETLLKQEVGSSYNTGRTGYWLHTKDVRHIGYHALFVKYGRD